MTNLPVRWGHGGFEEMEGDPSNGGGGEWFWSGVDTLYGLCFSGYIVGTRPS